MISPERVSHVRIDHNRLDPVSVPVISDQRQGCFIFSNSKNGKVRSIPTNDDESMRILVRAMAGWNGEGWSFAG
jgi:hypothetical protein